MNATDYQWIMSEREFAILGLNDLNIYHSAKLLIDQHGEEA